MKYSIVLPTLNGGDYLKEVIKKYLKFTRDDVEFIVSDNLSDDGTYEFLSNLNDTRFKIIQPDKRLTLNTHLEFAYKHATGEWQSHIGDDDILIKNHFEIKDFMIKEYECEVYRFNHYRYHWPSQQNNFRGQIDDFNFKMDIQVFSAKDYYKYLLSQKSIGGGSDWLIKKSIKEQVIEKIGYYAAENVEFFSSRSSCYYADKVCVIDAPIYIMGRAPKSSATQVFQNKSSRKSNQYQESFEWKNRLEFSPFPTRTVASISLNASLNCFSKLKISHSFAWQYWIEKVVHDFRKLKKRGMVNHSLFNEILEGFIYGIKHKSARGNVSILFWINIFLKFPLVIINKFIKKNKEFDDNIDVIKRHENVFENIKLEDMPLNNLKSISKLSDILKPEMVIDTDNLIKK